MQIQVPMMFTSFLFDLAHWPFLLFPTTLQLCFHAYTILYMYHLSPAKYNGTSTLFEYYPTFRGEV